MERWDDLGAYFGVHRSNTVSETRSIGSMETQVFNDALSGPRFAVLKFLAEQVSIRDLSVSCVRVCRY